MTPTQELLLQALHDEGIQPSIIDEADENTTYIGYCLPDCKSFADSKWLIKRIKSTTDETNGGTIQTIGYPNGSRKFERMWSNHRSYTYKITPELNA